MVRNLVIVIVGVTSLFMATALGSGGEFYTVPVGEGLIEGISDNGIAAGSFGTSEYFMWTVSGGSMLIGGTVPGGGVGGQGKISNDGTRICGTSINTASGFNEMSYYDVAGGTWTPLGGIGGTSGTEMSSGWNISGDGLNVVGLGWVNAGEAHATQWEEGVGTWDVGSTVAGSSSRLSGADYDGNVVVGWQDGAGRQGAVWVDGVQELIFNGTDVAWEAFDVTGDGEWVTGLGMGGIFDPGYAYRYNTVTDVYESLPILTVGAERSMAGTGITDDGQTIVGGTWGMGPATFGNAFIWREGIGTIDFSDYLDEVGISYPATFHFAFVSAISSKGDWIAGWGNDGGPANSQSWIVHIPLTASTPEISAAVGGIVDFNLMAGADQANSNYALLASITGTSPGTTLPGGLVLPLNWDVFTDLALAMANSPAAVDFLGVFDADGFATAQLNTWGPLDPGAAGTTMHFAYTTFDPFDFVSNAVSVVINP